MCVNNKESSNIELLADIWAGREIPLNDCNFLSFITNGTNPGLGLTTLRLNLVANSYPNLVAPNFGIDNPPVAITRELQATCPKSVVSS